MTELNSSDLRALADALDAFAEAEGRTRLALAGAAGSAPFTLTGPSGGVVAVCRRELDDAEAGEYVLLAEVP